MEKKRILLILGIAMCTIFIIKICTSLMFENAIKNDEGSDLNESVKSVDDENNKASDDKSKEIDEKSKESEKSFKKRSRNKRKSGDEKNKASEENLNGKPVEKKAKLSKEGSAAKKAKLSNENSVEKKVNDKNINSVVNENQQTKSNEKNTDPAKSEATVNKKKRKRNRRNKKKQNDLIKIQNESDLLEDSDKLNLKDEDDTLTASQKEAVEIWFRNKQKSALKPPLPPKPQNLRPSSVYFLPENSAKMDFLDSCFRSSSAGSTFSSFGHSQKSTRTTEELSEVLKYDQEVANSMFDVLDFEIHDFVKTFTRNPQNKINKVEDILKNASTRFYRRGTREFDILSLFVFIARIDKNSLNGDVRLQNIYKNLMMIYADKYLQILIIHDLKVYKKEPEIDSFLGSTEEDHNDHGDSNDHINTSHENPQKFYIPLPISSPIDLDLLSENYEVFLSEFSTTLNDIPEDNVALFQNLLNFLNCFYVRLKPRLDKFDARDLIKIFKCMFEHLKIAVNMPENERKKLVGYGSNCKK